MLLWKRFLLTTAPKVATWAQRILNIPILESWLLWQEKYERTHPTPACNRKPVNCQIPLTRTSRFPPSPSLETPCAASSCLFNRDTGTKLSLFANKHLKDYCSSWSGPRLQKQSDDCGRRQCKGLRSEMPQGRDLVATCALRSGGQRPHLERTETRRVSVTSQFITCTERSHCHQQHCAVLLTIQVQ